MNTQPLSTISTDTPSSKPVLPKLNIPQTDISIFDPSDTTPKPSDNMANTSPITTINISPITAIVKRVHSVTATTTTTSNSPSLPALESQSPVSRPRGTRLSDYDTNDDDDDAGSVLLPWRAQPPRRGGEVVGWNEPVGDGLGDLLLGEVNEAWCRNAGDLPRGEGAVWEGLVAGRKVWVEDLRVVTRGRMGVKRLVGKGGSGGGSPLRVGVSAEELGGIRSGNGNGNGGRYRVSRFREVDVHGEMGGVERELRAEKGGDDDGGREEQREVSGRKRGLGKRMWKKVTGWNI